jgi:hypothetical protein
MARGSRYGRKDSISFQYIGGRWFASVDDLLYLEEMTREAVSKAATSERAKGMTIVLDLYSDVLGRVEGLKPSGWW